MNLKKIIHDKKIISCILSIFIISVVLFLSKSSISREFIEQGNLGIKNILFRKYGANTVANKDIVIVAIDEKSLSPTGSG